MLTADLVRVTVRKDVVRPRFVDPADADLLGLAEALIGTFERCRGESREVLDGELEDLLGTGTEFLLHRGLAKLLLDGCDFEVAAPVEPAELRTAVFTAAAAGYRQGGDERHPGGLDSPRLQPVVDEVRGRYGLGADELRRALYADLKGRQVLCRFESRSPAQLLQRYNTALAQAVLLRARDLTVEITRQSVARYRTLLRKIKFFRLLHRVEPIAGGYRVHLDGPLSMFQASSRYGLQMASFLPTLLHFDGWRLEARLLWGKRRRRCRFELGSEHGLAPTSRLSGQWLPEELGFLPQQLEKLGGDWQVSTEGELIPLGGQGVLVPDYVFRHTPSGLEVPMEVFGFWNRGAVASRLALLRAHGPSRMILGLSRALAGGAGELEDLPGRVYVFRSAPVAREVLKLLEGFLDEPEAKNGRGGGRRRKQPAAERGGGSRTMPGHGEAEE